MTFSIRLCLDTKSSRRIEALWPRMNLRSTSYTTDPHISLINFEGEAPQKLISALGTFASDVKPFSLNISFIGVAKTYQSIMLLPVVTTELLELHKSALNFAVEFGITPLSYYQVNRWAPHITIADATDFEDFSAALNVVFDSNVWEPVEVRSVRAIQYKQREELCRFDLTG